MIVGVRLHSFAPADGEAVVPSHGVLGVGREAPGVLARVLRPLGRLAAVDVALAHRGGVPREVVGRLRCPGAALDRGLGVIRKNYESSLKKGKLTQAKLDERMGLITPTLSYDAFRDVDLAIEAASAGRGVANLGPVLAWALVFASPKEGWGITNLEAAACATPVVASNSPGIRESVRDGETGYLVPHGDEHQRPRAPLLDHHAGRALRADERRNRRSRQRAQRAQRLAHSQHALGDVDLVAVKVARQALEVAQDLEPGAPQPARFASLRESSPGHAARSDEGRRQIVALGHREAQPLEHWSERVQHHHAGRAARPAVPGARAAAGRAGRRRA